MFVLCNLRLSGYANEVIQLVSHLGYITRPKVGHTPFVFHCRSQIAYKTSRDYVEDFLCVCWCLNGWASGWVGFLCLCDGNCIWYTPIRWFSIILTDINRIRFIIPLAQTEPRRRIRGTALETWRRFYRRGRARRGPVLSFSFERHVPFVLACRRGPSCVFSALFRHSDNGSITCFTFTLTDGGPVLLFYGKFSVFLYVYMRVKKKSSGELPTFVHFWRLGATHQIKEAYFWNAVNVIISFNWMKLFRYR